MRYRQQETVKRRVFASVFVFFLIILGIFLVKTGKYIPAFFQLIFQNGINLKTNTDNRVNILVMGIGGGTHDGPNLTDTMIYASIDPVTKKVNLVSIPRDLWMPELKAKINTAYAVGEAKEKGGGLKLAKASVSRLLNQQIDYGVRIDFDGFVKAVDMVGGLDITVERTLDDPQYPISGKEVDPCGHSDDEIASLSAQISTDDITELDAFPCRFEHIVYRKGLNHLDGLSTLKYVRSRHAQGVEGTDFARSKRQEKVISAFKDKVFSAGTFLNPVKLVSLVSVLSGSIDTDIKEDEYDDFVKLAQGIKGGKIDSAILDIGDEQAGRIGLLEHPESGDYDGQYVLVPTQGNGKYSEIQEYIGCEIKYGNCNVTKTGITTPTPEISPSKKR
jgi:LCP family protein required for cell wall assembly